MRHPYAPPLTLLASLGLLAGLLMAPAGADEPDPCADPDTGELVFEEQEVWIKPAETKVGNLAPLGVGSFPTWDEDEPEESVAAGAGAGYLVTSAGSIALGDDTPTEFEVHGEAPGCLDTMLLDLYAFLPTNRTGTAGDLEERPFNGVVDLDINGQPAVFGTEVEMSTEPNPAGDATYRIRFAIDNLYASVQRIGADPTEPLELELRIDPRFINTNNAIFVYDTTEVPAGIEFNGEPDDDHPTISGF